MNRKGDWMQLASGKQFWPLDPRADEIFIEDIAAALSKQCRFAGHVRVFYSVAQHCCGVFDMALEENASESLQKAALLHDASEAYAVDVPRPLKPFLTNYHEIELRLETAVEKRFDIPAELIRHPRVKHWDNVMLATEKRDVMGPAPAAWTDMPDPLPKKLVAWDCWRAENEFLKRARILGL